MQINPYLTFDGDCAQAFRFYADLLRGNVDVIMTHGQSPMADQVPPAWRDKVIHAQITVKDSVLMGSDYPPDEREKPQGFSVCINVDQPAEAERIFKGLAETGTVRMPLQETFWARSFGTVVDRFGTPWMINCSRPM